MADEEKLSGLARILSTKKTAIFGLPATEEQIDLALYRLKTPQIPKQYHTFLTTVGTMSYGVHRIAGLGGTRYTDMTYMTLRARTEHQLPNGWTVFQSISRVSNLMLLDPNGKVYNLRYGVYIPVCESLFDYIAGLDPNSQDPMEDIRLTDDKENKETA